MDDERPHSPLDDHRRRRRHPGRRARPGDVAFRRDARRGAARRAHRPEEEGEAQEGGPGRRHPRPSRRDRPGPALLLDADDPQRREPEPALRTGRRQPDVPILPVLVGGLAAGGHRRRRRVPAADLRAPRRGGIPGGACRSSGCCGAGASGSSSSSRPCPTRSS